MEKISVSIRIPAIGGTYDFIVPDCMPVKNVVSLILRILSSEYGISEQGPEAMLFDVQSNKALRSECSLSQLDITDGAKLLLI